MNKYPIVIHLKTFQIGTADITGTIPSKGVPNAVDLPFVPLFESPLGIFKKQTAEMTNIPSEGGISQVFTPMDKNLRGVYKGGLVFVSDSITKNGTSEYMGGVSDKILPFQSEFIRKLRQEIRDLQNENLSLRSRINELSSSNLSELKTAAKGKALFDTKEEKKRQSDNSEFLPTLGDT